LLTVKEEANEILHLEHSFSVWCWNSNSLEKP